MPMSTQSGGLAETSAADGIDDSAAQPQAIQDGEPAMVKPATARNHVGDLQSTLSLNGDGLSESGNQSKPRSGRRHGRKQRRDAPLPADALAEPEAPKSARKHRSSEVGSKHAHDDSADTRLLLRSPLTADTVRIDLADLCNEVPHGQPFVGYAGANEGFRATSRAASVLPASLQRANGGQQALSHTSSPAGGLPVFVEDGKGFRAQGYAPPPTGHKTIGSFDDTNDVLRSSNIDGSGNDCGHGPTPFSVATAGCALEVPAPSAGDVQAVRKTLHLESVVSEVFILGQYWLGGMCLLQLTLLPYSLISGGSDSVLEQAAVSVSAAVSRFFMLGTTLAVLNSLNISIQRDMQTSEWLALRDAPLRARVVQALSSSASPLAHLRNRAAAVLASFAPRDAVPGVPAQLRARAPVSQIGLVVALFVINLIVYILTLVIMVYDDRLVSSSNGYGPYNQALFVTQSAQSGAWQTWLILSIVRDACGLVAFICYTRTGRKRQTRIVARLLHELAMTASENRQHGHVRGSP